MKKIILSIDGMTCSACSNGLEKYLNKQNGVYNASVNLVMANASIEYGGKLLTIDNLNEFVKKAGFKRLGEFKEIKIELNPYEQKIEKEINDFLHQEITWQKVKNFLFQDISFGKKKEN